MSLVSSTPTIARSRPTSSNEVGTLGAVTGVSPAGLTLQEFGGAGIVRKTVFTFTNYLQLITDYTTNGAAGGTKIYDFPTGALLFVGTPIANLAISRVGTNIQATAAVVASLGSAVVAANTNATLTGTEADILPSTTATLTAGVGAVQSTNSATLQIGGSAPNTATDMYLNFNIPDAGMTDSTTDSLSVTGTLEVCYIILGSR